MYLHIQELHSWEVTVLWNRKQQLFSNVSAEHVIVAVLQDGVYIKGLYLQGAGWDKKNSVLIEAEPMQLVCPLPSIHFKPTEAKKKSSKGKRESVCGS